jgi:hypothetical protein
MQTLEKTLSSPSPLYFCNSWCSYLVPSLRTQKYLSNFSLLYSTGLTVHLTFYLIILVNQQA